MSTIIFDFDGTIADTFGLVVNILHDLTHQTERVSPERIELLRGLSLRLAAEEMQIPIWKMPFMASKGRRLMHAQMASIHAFDGMPEALKTLAADGHKLYVMSSNSVQNIDLFMRRHGMSNEFIKLYGNVGLLGKARVLRRVIRQNQLDKKQLYYVGDEVRDIEGAKHAGVKVLAVTWGYNNEASLAAHAPNRLIHTPEELVKYFKQKL